MPDTDKPLLNKKQRRRVAALGEARATLSLTVGLFSTAPPGVEDVVSLAEYIQFGLDGIEPDPSPASAGGTASTFFLHHEVEDIVRPAPPPRGSPMNYAAASSTQPRRTSPSMSDQYRSIPVDVVARQFDGTKESQNEVIAWANPLITTSQDLHRGRYLGSWNDTNPEPTVDFDSQDHEHSTVVTRKGEWIVIRNGRPEKRTATEFAAEFEQVNQ